MDPSTYQAILDAAIRSEIESNRFYQEVAGKVADPYLKDMFIHGTRA